MSYLKIYPKRIIATLNAEGGFEGVFTLQIEINLNLRRRMLRSPT